MGTRFMRLSVASELQNQITYDLLTVHKACGAVLDQTQVTKC